MPVLNFCLPVLCPLRCLWFRWIQCIECNAVIDLHKLICSFFSYCVVFFIWCHVSQSCHCQFLGCFISWNILQSYQYAMISMYHCPNQKGLVPGVPFCLLSFPGNVLHTFLNCFISVSSDIGFCLFVFFVTDKKVSHLLLCGSLTTTFANVLESSHNGCVNIL